jgi:DAK2 domain fusion protein YloV
MDAKTLQKAFLAGAKNLELNKEILNDLNVFPVPDGDTGTNMSLTINAAAKEVSQLADPDFKTISKAISMGALRGARGNSGVITSQILRGFTKEISEAGEITTRVLADACQRGVETAYKAVMKPKEGTILTVAKGIAERAAQVAEYSDDIILLVGEALKHGEFVLSKTPDMLPVLKQAGVVDAGGQGLIELIKGAYNALIGKAEDIVITPVVKPTITQEVPDGSTEHIKFGYCTEFIVLTENEVDESLEDEFKSFLSGLGDSIVVVADEGIIKVHVHTNDPGLAIQKGLSYGSLTSMKIDNMREEHNEKVIKDIEKLQAQAESEADLPIKDTGFIAVSIGEGLNEIFRELGVDYVIEGGQTMNPSTEDMLNAIEKVNAKTIFILPNNKNIILAAQQARDLVEDKNIIVIPSTTVPQGISAIINYAADKSVEENSTKMEAEMLKVRTGQVTFAVRDTSLNDKKISQGDILGIGDSEILSVMKEVESTTIDLVSKLVGDGAELISIYYGEDVTEEEATRLSEYFQENYPDCDVELQYGGQPLYYYVISVE